MPERKVHIVFACFFTVFALAAAFYLFHPRAHAANASLYVTPALGTFTVGSTFTLSVYVNTGGQAVNAIQADLKFPPDKLQVVSPTVGKSLVQIWIGQPAFSNTEGTLHFQGTVPHPGITTDAGLVSTVTFRVMQTGSAQIAFADTSRVLLDDGQGTDILGQTTDGIYTLALPPPAGPLVTSPTMPDQGTWYPSKAIVFAWAASSGAEGYSYLLNQNPVDDPGNISQGAGTTVSYRDLADGVYYFHIKALRGGSWGGITNYKVQVDNTPPAAFTPTVAPDSYTSSQTPVIYFDTTDAISGIDHYEIKIIPLDPPAAQAQNQPFFIEASSPYSTHLDNGRYDVVIRAYDAAGNYYQAITRITIAPPTFTIIRGEGIHVGGNYTVPWIYVDSVGVLLLVMLGFFARKAWGWHREIEELMRHGAMAHPMVEGKAALLKEKQDDYRGGNGAPPAGTAIKALFWLLLGAAVALGAYHASSARAQAVEGGAVNPPLITVYPTSVSNDEIPYLGGTAQSSDATVVIFVQNAETGGTLSYAALTDKNGQWFFSFPQFLDPGHYEAWTELKMDNVMSPPSARVDFAVAPTAIQVGGAHVSYETFYLAIVLILLVVIGVLLALMTYHYLLARSKHRRFMDEVRKVEESLRRGFLLLRHDIEAELAAVASAKTGRALSDAEKEREAKLLRDLETMSRHAGKEVWELGEKEGREE